MNPFRKKRAPDIIAALAFHDDGVSVAKVRRGVDVPPVLEACEFQPVSGGDADWPEALEAIGRRHGLARVHCHAVMAQGDYSLLLVEAPDVPAEELRSAVRWKVRDLIDFHVDDAVIDVFDVPSQKDTGRPAMMYVVAARIPEVRRRTSAFDDSGLELDVVDIPELAQRNIAAQLAEDVAGIALLCVGPDSGLITLTRQGVLYLTRRVDVGTSSIAAFPSPDADDPRLRGWLDSLAVEVQRSLDYYDSHFNQPPIGALAIAPTSIAIPGIDGYLGQQLGLDASCLDITRIVDCPIEVGIELQARCFTAMGAALRTEARSL